MGQSVSLMPHVAASTVDTASTPATTKEKPKCKACCACPETKRARDACIMENGEEKCSELIEKHKQCMRDMGFNI
ncbi:cytochrome c oxidase copper chaperone [Anopheles arabiensis]|uniref:Cytochrome c oxidase copper chaperone n=1 Tax=Anopheles arabiensis TaxID=7173 RepID=A0A182HHD9_ANOAR|nr:cytochrome c oxidase copper chaperone [Anopheles arabiensis]XP_040169961.1 cytochrome c oxidase copper chaperone [Anopheles arabiensis]XP_061512956.1 cytochrome c oxidase copper chaperone [Anopheles gambiae]XP_061512957.1 cytochrome c oxidase copper chaperone [Anopheles gambiae]